MQRLEQRSDGGAVVDSQRPGVEIPGAGEATKLRLRERDGAGWSAAASRGCRREDGTGSAAFCIQNYQKVLKKSD